MRLLLQRVRQAAVLVDDQEVAGIGHGLLIFVGIGEGDGAAECRWLAHKAAGLRVFDDEDGVGNLSLLHVGGEALVVSQFTLYANTDKGRRPSYVAASAPEVAEPLVELFADELRQQGVTTKTGRFGAHMQVELINDGPVTIWIEKSPD